jgi:carbohydrate esterase-like sialic acid-specific acetylesterase
MGKRNLVSFAAATVLLISPAWLIAAEPEADLWILSGQSNACGRGQLPGPQPHPQVLMFDKTLGKFVTAEDPLPGMGSTGAGPWVAAAQLVAAELNLPIRICGYASGGKPIAYWHPGQPGHKGLFPVIKEAGQQADVFLWYQGENDCGGRLSIAEYRNELTEHVARVREAASNPQMLAVIIQLGPSLREGRSGYMSIREAQRQFVLHDANAVLVPALGRTLKDSVHLDTAGYRELGREIGRAVLKIRHRKPVGDWPGPVLDAAVLRPDDKARSRTTVVAHFAEVRQLAHADTSDFAVMDAEGTNRCRELEVGKTVVTLSVERDVVLPAKLVYGFGTKPKASLTDEAGNRAPAVQLPITLGDPPKDTATTFPNS